MSDAKKNKNLRLNSWQCHCQQFGDFCPYTPYFSSTLLHCRNILSLLQRHIGLSNMRFALSIGHDWRGHQAEIINLPPAGLQEEGVRVWAPHLMASNGTVTLQLPIPGTGPGADTFSPQFCWGASSIHCSEDPL